MQPVGGKKMAFLNKPVVGALTRGSIVARATKQLLIDM